MYETTDYDVKPYMCTSTASPSSACSALPVIVTVVIDGRIQSLAYVSLQNRWIGIVDLYRGGDGVTNVESVGVVCTGTHASAPSVPKIGDIFLKC
mgnify:CR=1 FL=1